MQKWCKVVKGGDILRHPCILQRKRRGVRLLFTGTYENKIDAKGRTFIPAKVRSDFNEKVVLTRWLDSCVAVYTVDVWEGMKEKLLQLPSAKAKDTQRFFFSAAETVEIDKQGRVLVPPVLRKFAGLENDVVIIGVGERMEIWNKERWEEYNNSDFMQDNILNAMVELGI